MMFVSPRIEAEFGGGLHGCHNTEPLIRIPNLETDHNITLIRSISLLEKISAKSYSLARPTGSSKSFNARLNILPVGFLGSEVRNLTLSCSSRH